MGDLRRRVRELNEARKRYPRRKSYSVVGLLMLLLLVYGARPGTLGQSGWRGPGGEVLAYVRCGWTNDVTVHLNPRLRGEARELALVHENVHVDQAREIGCFLFNLSGRVSPRVRLEREAQAHCAELRHRMARFAAAIAADPDERRRHRWERAARFGETRIFINLMGAEAYAGIADLGPERVRASIRSACALPGPGRSGDARRS